MKDGKEHGKGVITFPNGKTYDSEWKDGKAHGNGGRAHLSQWEDV